MKLPTIPPRLAGKIVKYRPLSEPIRLQDLEDFRLLASLEKNKICYVVFFFLITNFCKNYYYYYYYYYYYFIFSFIEYFFVELFQFFMFQDLSWIFWKYVLSFVAWFLASSETQGQIMGARESLNRWENMAQNKSKERREEPLGTMSYQTSSKRSPPFWLLISARP